MIHKVEMFGATCDGCKTDWHQDDGITCWNEPDFVKDSLEDYEWHITEDGKTYCPNCHRFDDDGNLILTCPTSNSNKPTSTIKSI
jgi:uncharacterized Zn finger protein (UPF0148 family)